MQHRPITNKINLVIHESRSCIPIALTIISNPKKAKSRIISIIDSRTSSTSVKVLSFNNYSIKRVACNAIPECKKRRNAFKKAVQRFNISAETIS
jgi:hypothetical protein